MIYTLDYCILLKKCKKMNLAHTTVKMIYSHLVNHSQKKRIEDKKLILLPIFCSVPHVSSLNAVLLNLYFAVNLQYVCDQHQYCTLMTQQNMDTFKSQKFILVIGKTEFDVEQFPPNSYNIILIFS